MRKIRVGTDCSGIEAPIQALQQLGINFTHEFSSDIDKYCRNSIEANYDPKIIYEDMTKREISNLPAIDLYVCGFPCQSFSTAGNRKGTKEKRGQIFWECLDVINETLPSVFILENVKGILSIENGKTWKIILKELSRNQLYDIDWKLLNTKDYGIPQNRERVFIVGIRRDSKIKFEWPATKKMKKLSSFVDENNTLTETIAPYLKKSNLLERIPDESQFVDISFTQNNFPYSDIYSPCITTGGHLWCVPLQRHASIKELLSLQGFPKRFKQVVSDTQMKKQIGNSMSVCILKEIFKQIYV
jgi:DNA (cytosine-5)-methyltransferase 1